MDKTALRNNMKKLRNSMDIFERKKSNEDIYQKFIKRNEFANAKNIFIYVSFGSEVDTHRIIKQAIKDNKDVYVPKVMNREEGMLAVQIRSLDDLKRSSYGILEPVNVLKSSKPCELDLIVIPGLAFDRQGGRLGYGAGYYDSFLKQTKENTQMIALAYSFQVIEKVPMEEHDVFIKDIITD